MPEPQNQTDEPGPPLRDLSPREQVTAKEPERKLTEGLKKSGGRNSNAASRPPPRRRAKRRYRKIDFKRLKDGVPAKVATIEYDPNALATSPWSTTPTGSRTTSSPGRAESGGHGESVPRPTSNRVTRWRWVRCRPAPSSITWR